MARRDKRGRRIGHNWWRVYNCTLLLDARHAREALRENGGGLQMEDDEFALAYPQPTLKAFLIANAGMSTDPDNN